MGRLDYGIVLNTLQILGAVMFNLISQAIKFLLLEENKYHWFSNYSSCKITQETAGNMHHIITESSHLTAQLPDRMYPISILD